MSRMISSFLSVYLIYLQAAFSLHRRTYQRSSVPRERVNMKKEERKKEEEKIRDMSLPTINLTQND